MLVVSSYGVMHLIGLHLLSGTRFPLYAQCVFFIVNCLCFEPNVCFLGFQKLVEKQGKQQKTKLKKNLRVTFALDMEVESNVINGSHEPDIEEVEDEKILKPRKPVFPKETDAANVAVNGSSENGSVADTVEIVNGENGHDEEIENSDMKPIKRSSRISEKREGTPKKQTGKESTPKPEIPSKRELRRKETPQKETTPKPDTPNKRKAKPVKNSKSQADQETDLRSSENAESQEKNVTNVEDGVIDEVIIINDSLDENKPESKSRSFFSVFRRSSSSNSPDGVKNLSTASASSPSIVCLDSPSYSDRNFTPSSDIRGRKAINAFSRFPGRNVSITSVDSPSTKRKADESACEDSPRKRFAGETESGSEKSPGELCQNKN